MTVLLFDIDNTLLDFDKAEYNALGKLFASYHITDTQENRSIYSQVNKGLWRRHEAEEISRQELLSTRFIKAFEALGASADKDGYSIDLEYEHFLSQGHELMGHASELLTALSSQHQEMYIVSNGTSRVSRPRIVESGISSYFQEIFISEEVGAHKPAKAFFDYVFGHIDHANEKEFAIVGDSLTTDIQGGKNAGIKTIWYNPKHLQMNGSVIPDVQIEDLLEITQLINYK
ncbi:YjjG family noncanonical pyrimidine nucleotidase [Lactococcus nasutitermitis]|uniref:YjjG family noncanonical pyrimidine nucleotidase n=1 Tax=Lactococcus nasutitermitis TaxID=1652957 RepID=A0ABV9JE13_9LACT|nr:YjjG family noncanonical pyrimidine nucleotidase [Lactococcus nasutitermitis]